MRIRLRAKKAGAPVSPMASPEGHMARFTHRKFLKGLLGGGVAAGITAVVSAPGANATYVPGPPGGDRVDTDLEVDGHLTVDGDAGVGAGVTTATPAARLRVRGVGPQLLLDAPAGDVDLRLARAGTVRWSLSVAPDDSFRLTYGTAQLSPTAIPGCKLWLRADSLALADGASIDSWPDSSGAGWHLSQPNAAARPTFRANALGGNPVVRFDGVSQFLTNSAFNSLDNNLNGLTVFVVFKTNAPAGTGFAFDTGAQRVRIHTYSTGLHAYVSPGYAHVAFSSTAYTRLTQVFDGTQPDNATRLKLFVDGVQKALTFDANMPASAGTGVVGLDVGRRLNSTYYWNGDIAEMVFYDRALTPQERLQVEGYLATKYSGGAVPSQVLTALSTGNVGVAVPMPQARLHVRGGAVHLGFHTGTDHEGHLSLSGVGAGLNIARTNLTAWPATPAAGDAYRLYNDAGSLRLSTSAAGNLVVLSSTGSLGVGSGVLTPGAKLDVAGDLRATGPIKVGANVVVESTGELRTPVGLRVNNAVAIDATGAATKTYYAP